MSTNTTRVSKITENSQWDEVYQSMAESKGKKNPELNKVKLKNKNPSPRADTHLKMQDAGMQQTEQNKDSNNSVLRCRGN